MSVAPQAETAAHFALLNLRRRGRSSLSAGERSECGTKQNRCATPHEHQSRRRALISSPAPTASTATPAATLPGLSFAKLFAFSLLLRT